MESTSFSGAFDHRASAGRLLAAELDKRGTTADAVLGLIRGGVPVAYEVAAVLEAALDIVAVKKLRSPLSPELAVGAVCSDGSRVIRPDILEDAGGGDHDYLDSETRERIEEARRAEEGYRRGQTPIDVSGTRVVLVDDGMATGSSMQAAVASMRIRRASHVMVAVPVASESAVLTLQESADEVVALQTPADFWAVGQYYREFPQVSDDEVKRLLSNARRLFHRAAS